MEPKGPQVELGKETRKQILDALKNIKSQISQAKHRESTPADVAADVIASGGGPIAAAKEALAFKAAKAKSNLKRKLDPLNIINRMTGSKLATTVAGRLMGRSEASIRSAAGLQPKEDTPTSIATAISPSTPEETQVSRVSSGVPSKAFERMSKMLGIIALRVTDIAVKMKATKTYVKDKDKRLHDAATGQFVSSKVVAIEEAQTRLLKDIADRLLSNEEDEEESTGYLKRIADGMEKANDAAAEDRYKQEFSRKATRLGSDNKPIAPSEQKEPWYMALMKSLMGHEKSFIGLLGSGFALAAKTLGSFLMSVISKLKDKIIQFLGFSWDMLGKAGSLAKEGAWEATKKAGTGIMKWGKEMLGIPQTPTPPTTVPPVTPPTTGKVPTPTPGGKAIPVPKPSIKEVIKSTGAKVVGKMSGAVAKSLPFIGGIVGAGSALKSLLDGDKTQAAIDAGAGLASMTGVGGVAALPVTMAATLANEAYKAMYGVDPLSDPSKDQRLPEIAQAASDYVKEYLTANATPAPTTPDTAPAPAPTVPSAVSEVPPPGPTSGAALMESADLRASAQGATSAPAMVGPITNVRNNNINNTTVQQNMASPRSGESSYLRFVNRDFVPS